LYKLVLRVRQQSGKLALIMSEIKSLARGLKAIDMLLAEDALTEHELTSVSVSALASHLGINKSSASRLMSTLCQYGYAERVAGSRGYRLGHKLQGHLQTTQLGSGYVRLRELAQPFLHQLVELTGECAHAAVHSSKRALVIADVDAPASLKVSGVVGRTEALHCTAIGKCLLAFMDLPLPEDLTARTEYTLSEVGELELHLATIRSQGYAFDNEENYLGVRCLAAPVYDDTGQCIACIGISGPSVRIPLSRIPELAAQVQALSLTLSQTLGYMDRAGMVSSQ
jgi:DNA-binding IclR family transcriptional regulator